MVVYLFFAICALMVAAWAIYVLPTPGPLTSWELTGAFWPALLMFAGVLASFAVLGLAMATLNFLVTIVRRWWQG